MMRHYIGAQHATARAGFCEISITVVKRMACIGPQSPSDMSKIVR